MEDRNLNASPWAMAIKWGLIGGFIIVLIDSIFKYFFINAYESGDTDPSILQGIINVVLILAVVIFVLVRAQLNHRAELGGYMSYGRALGIATIAGLVVGVFMGLYTYVLYGIIKPELLAYEAEVSLNAMAKFGMEEEQLGEMQERLNENNPLQMAISSIFSWLVGFFLIGLITSIFTRRSPELES